VRASERIYLAYFTYVVILAAILRPQIAFRAFLIAIGIGLAIHAIARSAGQSPAFAGLRDWLPLAYILVAYRQMDWFTPATRDHHFENSWIVWDRVLLDQWGLRGAIESLGWLLPGYLEFCYLLVYGVGAISLGAIYGINRNRVDAFLCVYATGTLLAYAMFPFFPSDPPRVVFAGLDEPGVTTIWRTINLYLVGNYGIHSSVFPSAHVSSAFAAGWGLVRFFPERPWIGRTMLFYAVSVSLATVYGRYHYAAEAVAGAGVSLVALALTYRIQTVRSRHAAV
jgi:membrane-associated phospholipid phosphatase